MMTSYRSYVARKTEDGFVAGFETRSKEELPEGEVTIRVEYSGVNYKDGLAATDSGRVVSAYPRVLGIDLAGTVEASTDARFGEGDAVLVTGYGLGVSHDGGYAEYARVPADWVVPLPSGLTTRDAMALGTAGLTAALSLRRLLDNGLMPQSGPVLVTGATGGVGSLAVAMLAKAGFDVVASTGKPEQGDYLRRIGAKDVINRASLTPDKPSPLQKQRFVLGSLAYGGSAAVSGMAGGSEFQASVFPFILRGVNVLGIDSVACPMPLRLDLWRAMTEEWNVTPALADIAEEIAFEALPQRLAGILGGGERGRAVVRIGGLPQSPASN